MVSRRKLRQQTERNSQAAQSSLANFKPAAPATPSFRFPGVQSNKKGGKLEDKQKAFVAYLIQTSGVENEDELNDYKI